jgi:hypothetical protein
MSRDHTYKVKIRSIEMIQEAENEQCIEKPSQLYDQNHWLIKKNYMALSKKNYMAPKLHNLK